MTSRDDQRPITLQLLDSSQGHPLQTWEFDSRSLVRIGRADDNDLIISDRRVSRSHVELRRETEGWRLFSKGRNGVLVGGLPVKEVLLADRDTFELGSGGPKIRFREDYQTVDNSATLSEIGPSMLEMLQVDEVKKAQEVREITEGSLFQQLKQRADELRRSSPTTERDVDG